MKNKIVQFVLLIIGLTALGFLLYGNVINGPFFYDDMGLVEYNQQITSFEYFTEWFTTSPSSGAGINTNLYRPIPTVLNAIVYKIGGLNHAYYHILNILLHIANSVLVFFLLKGINLKKSLAVLGSIIFLAHPVQTESVAYIAGLPDVLAPFFVLMSLILFLKTFDTSDKKTNIALIILASLSYLLALLSKESAIHLFLLMPLLVVFKWDCLDKKQKKKTLYNFIPIITITIAYLFINLTILQHADTKLITGMEIYTESIINRTISFISIIQEYLILIFFPKHLFFDKPFLISTSILTVRGILGLAFIIFGGALSIISLRRKKYFALGFIWFFFALAPVSGILIPSNAIYTEHWLYLPIIGFIIIIMSLISEMKKKKIFTILMISIYISCLPLGILTMKRNLEWKNPWSFFIHELEYNQTPRLYAKLGNLYLEVEQYEKAAEVLEKAVNQEILVINAYHNLAVAYHHLERYDDALKYYLKTLFINPDFKKAYGNLILLFKTLEMYDAAEVVKDYATKTSEFTPTIDDIQEMKEKLNALYPKNL
ncbi:tetratricopeptide repeat protein [Candidatus Peregrinibacteria bacterium]|jgi:protein O-mannosyl-transferase|nr:tetratricopeptide repeat protein [Candidatus Peregrinibacteria bacterium]